MLQDGPAISGLGLTDKRLTVVPQLLAYHKYTAFISLQLPEWHYFIKISLCNRGLIKLHLTVGELSPPVFNQTY